MRDYLKYIFLIMILVSICNCIILDTAQGQELDSDMVMDDNAITAMVIGVWNETFSRDGYESKSLNIYYPDMYFESYITLTIEKDFPDRGLTAGTVLQENVSGKWVVMASEIITETMESSNPEVFKIGSISSSMVLHIDEKKAIYRFDTGQGYQGYRVHFPIGATQYTDNWDSYSGRPKSDKPKP
jgi:hypothetical protein